MASTVRVTITVPKDLKARMDAAEEAINWSAIASRAFEHKLADLISRREIRQMEDVVSRLRASKQKRDEGQFHVGFEYGKAWAESAAEAEELMRLDTTGADRWADWFGEDSNNAYSAGERFVFLIQPWNDGDRKMASDFWESMLANPDWEAQSGDPEFVRGFASGAHYIWSEVKDKL